MEHQLSGITLKKEWMLKYTIICKIQFFITVMQGIEHLTEKEDYLSSTAATDQNRDFHNSRYDNYQTVISVISIQIITIITRIDSKSQY